MRLILTETKPSRVWDEEKRYCFVENNAEICKKIQNIANGINRDADGVHLPQWSPKFNPSEQLHGLVRREELKDTKTLLEISIIKYLENIIQNLEKPIWFLFELYTKYLKCPFHNPQIKLQTTRNFFGNPPQYYSETRTFCFSFS